MSRTNQPRSRTRRRPRSRQRIEPLPKKTKRQLGRYHRVTRPAGNVILVVLATLLLGGLLNVQTLTEAAERRPNGFGRNVAIAFAWPFQQVSSRLGLDRTRELLDERLGRGDFASSQNGQGEDALVAAAENAGRLDSSGPGELEEPNVTSTVTPSPTLQLELGGTDVTLTERLTRPFTDTEPMNIVVLGDSLTEQVGATLIASADRPELPIAVVHEFEYSSGLTRPDFVDWPARAEQLTAEHDPDVWVVMMGANDAQDIRDENGHFVGLGTDEWETMYLGRIQAMMDQLTAEGRGVVWIGQPVMRSAGFDQKMQYLSELYRQAASERPLVSFLDSRTLLTDDNGNYSDYLPDSSGQLERVRLSDGIHLTREGGERITAAVIPRLPLDEETTNVDGETQMPPGE